MGLIANDLQNMTPAAISFRLLLRRLSPLAVLLLLCLQTLASSQSLHSALHGSEECHADSCAVALLSNGLVDLTVEDSKVALPLIHNVASVTLPESLEVPGIPFVHAERGPPAAH